MAQTADSCAIAELHPDSWRRHYRGAYSDSFLDGDVLDDRRAVWSERLQAPARTATILAKHDSRLVGFIHVVLDEDPKWGNLIDNLHVTHDHRHVGIGTELMAQAAQAISARSTTRGIYLWVLEQNTAARHFYEALDARDVETPQVPPPGGDQRRLNGTPSVHRMSWSDDSRLALGVRN